MPTLAIVSPAQAPLPLPPELIDRDGCLWNRRANDIYSPVGPRRIYMQIHELQRQRGPLRIPARHVPDAA